MNSEKMALKALYPELLLQNKLTPTKTTNGVIWTNKEAQVSGRLYPLQTRLQEATIIL